MGTAMEKMPRLIFHCDCNNFFASCECLEKPELKKLFDGFTFYPNTLSYGSKTNEGLPAIYGGYEYTPSKINQRPELSLVEKHNEALRMMPTIFGEEGYEVTICDPSYADYGWVPNLDIYDGMKNVNAYYLKGLFSAPPGIAYSAF